jgi:hypothetical protein
MKTTCFDKHAPTEGKNGDQLYQNQNKDKISAVSTIAMFLKGIIRSSEGHSRHPELVMTADIEHWAHKGLLC